MKDDTIVAISTPLGIGGIGIVRISGSDAIDTVNKIVKIKKGNLSDLPSHVLTYCKVIDPETDEIIDEAMVVVMRRPNSYTGEDVVEIHAHGSNVILRKIVKFLLDLGIRYAGPGEFTKRAFLNGKLDLAQAEAIAEIINAKTELAGKIAANKLMGTLSSKVEQIKQRLVNLISLIETDIEFSEDVEISYRDVINEAQLIKEEMEKLIKHSDLYTIFSEGIKIVIAGPPNVGKSSLLNLIAQRERAIVTEIPGTTRDIIEHQVSIEGIPAVLYDTAGVRKSDDIVEKEGIKRTYDVLEIADLILILVDVTQEFNEKDYVFYRNFKQKKRIILLNKIDLKQEIDDSQYKRFFSNKERMIKISAKTGENFEKLIDAIKEIVYAGEVNLTDGDFVLNDRQTAALKKAIGSIKTFLKDLKNEQYPEVLSVSAREAIFYLDEILGKNIDEQILENIFSNFCIGK